MNIYTNFCIQAMLCIISFIPIYLLIKSGEKLKNELKDIIKPEK